MNPPTIKYDESTQVFSGTKREEILKLDGVLKREMGNGYCWFELPPKEIEKRNIKLDLCFFGSELDSLSVYIIDEKPGWENWNEENELQNVEEIRSWFRDMKLKEGKYSWGEVWAKFDPKSGSGHGGIRFNTNKALEEIASRSAPSNPSR